MSRAILMWCQKAGPPPPFATDELSIALKRNLIASLVWSQLMIVPFCRHTNTQIEDYALIADPVIDQNKLTVHLGLNVGPTFFASLESSLLIGVACVQNSHLQFSPSLPSHSLPFVHPVSNVVASPDWPKHILTFHWSTYVSFFLANRPGVKPCCWDPIKLLSGPRDYTRFLG